MTDTPKKSWREARTVRLMQLSPTQIETFDLCKRKWWLKQVRKLPDLGIGKSGTFGDVVHAVIERFLKADQLGRDATGQPVNLYPDGWTQAKSRYTGEVTGEVNTAEAEVIKRLIAAAIDEGILERIEGRQVEAQFSDTLVQLKCPKCEGSGHIPCIWCGGEVPRHDGCTCDGSGIQTCDVCGGDGKGDNILVIGFIDYVWPEGIQDHKTTKSMRYAKSKADLRKNIQMLIYAKQLLDHIKQQGKPVPEKISLRHNVYCKDPNDLRVRKTEVFVDPEEVYQFWDSLKPIAQEMSMLRRIANGWHEVPPPASMAQACQAYGGCDFRGICAGQESEESYEKRVALQQAIVYNASESGDVAASVAAAIQQNTSEVKGSFMGLMDRLKAQQATGTAAPVQQAPQQPQAIVQQQAPAPQQAAAAAPASPGTLQAPPWANVNCMACKGLGFDTTGKPCRICDVSAANTGRAHSGMFQVLPQGDGMCYWKHLQSGQEGLSPMMASAGTPVQTETRVQQPIQMPPGQTFAQPTAPQQAPQTAPAQQQQQAPAQPDTRGRKKKSFTLCINCTVTEGTGSAKTRRMVDLFAEAVKELNEHPNVKGAGGYYMVDAFKRRDIMAQAADSMAEALGSDMVLVDLANATPDMKALVEAIRPFAAVEIVGTPN